MNHHQGLRLSSVLRFVILSLVGIAILSTTGSRAHASSLNERGGEVDVEYLLTIDNPKTGQARVTMTISNLSANAFEVEEFGSYTNVLELSACDDVCNPLTVEHFPDSGSSGGDVWHVQSNGTSRVTVDYTVLPGIISGSDYRGYIAADFAALSGEHVFLVPKDPVIKSISVSFDLPPGWSSYTPWPRQGDGYDPAIPGGPILYSLSVSSFALGQFDVYAQMIGTTEVAVATYHDWPIDVKEALAQQSWAIFAYQTAVFGQSVGDYYLAIFCPPAPDGHDIYVAEWSTSQGYSVRLEDEDSYWGKWDMFAHQIFHRWNCWPPWGIHGYNAWFIEGPDVLYELKTITKLRIERPYGNMEDALRWRYERYLEEYVAAGRDQSIDAWYSELDSFLIYDKGAMVAFLIAKEIYLRTDGRHNFDDLLQALTEKYGHHTSSCAEECLQSELATLTGTDFTQFFQHYVYGMTTLTMSCFTPIVWPMRATPARRGTDGASL